jgi:hypothetical protein
MVSVNPPAPSGVLIQTVAAVLFLACSVSLAVAAEPVPVVRPLPLDGVITRPGTYFLDRDLIVERETGIRIEADNVTLDLRGHALRYGGEPRPGVFGVVANGRSNVRITRGAIGGFWFGVHCTQNRGLRIDRMRFDDIVYIAVNVAQSEDIAIYDSTFTNFRYDIPKPKDTYVIGINIGAEDVVISGNTFDAEFTGGDPHKVGVETVFVLFSANVSKRCVVTLNEMSANVVLPRSYGVWVASNAHVTAVHNTIRNMKYGICLATDATAMAGFNLFAAEPLPDGIPAIDTVGVHAGAPKDIYLTGNIFEGLSADTTLPKDTHGGD